MTDQQDLRARLPELPPMVDLYARLGGCAWGYTADQMRTYALEAAAQLGRVESSELSKEDVEASEEAYREAIIGLKMKPPEWSSLAPMWHALRTFISRKPQLPAGVPDDFYLKILVAAGHITQEVAGQARDIAQSVLAAAPQLPAGVPEYDRELIADMLDDMCAKVPNSDTKYSHWSIQEMARLLRAADNRDAEGAHTAKREDGVPDGWALVPREPTPEMLRAGFLSESEGFDIETPADAPGLVYRAMLAAAPHPGRNTAMREVSMPDGFVLVPRELAERVDSALGRFCSDEGWTADDMGTIDDFGAVIAAAPQPDNKESR